MDLVGDADANGFMNHMAIVEKAVGCSDLRRLLEGSDCVVEQVGYARWCLVKISKMDLELDGSGFFGMLYLVEDVSRCHIDGLSRERSRRCDDVRHRRSSIEDEVQ